MDGSNSLSALATQLQTKTGGVHKIRFKFYQNLGTFVLPGFTADSLIFERAEGSAEVVEASPYAPSRMKPSPYRMSSRIPCISPACVFPGARAHPLDTCIFAPPKDSGWWTE